MDTGRTAESTARAEASDTTPEERAPGPGDGCRTGLKGEAAEAVDFRAMACTGLTAAEMESKNAEGSWTGEDAGVADDASDAVDVIESPAWLTFAALLLLRLAPCSSSSLSLALPELLLLLLLPLLALPADSLSDAAAEGGDEAPSVRLRARLLVLPLLLPCGERPGEAMAASCRRASIGSADADDGCPEAEDGLRRLALLAPLPPPLPVFPRLARDERWREDEEEEEEERMCLLLLLRSDLLRSLSFLLLLPCTAKGRSLTRLSTRRLGPEGEGDSDAEGDDIREGEGEGEGGRKGRDAPHTEHRKETAEAPTGHRRALWRRGRRSFTPSFDNNAAGSER